MKSSSLIRWRVVGLIAACAAVAHAQTAPPLKPGLWQVTSERLVDGQKVQMPDMSAQMANMPPEARKQMEAMMKQRGIDMSGGAGNTKICMTREQLDEGRWRSDEGSCKTDFTTRTSTLWKWRSVCTQPTSESEGEASIASPERYTVKINTTSNRKGEPRSMQMTMNAKWLGADCGDVKPLSPPPKTNRPAKP
ncbi:DUF3617 domain-containing protein [Piscinibacter sp. HJYY11]|uniref:DUF3617 domain-containing protein n=1 Tax=Piscinibacter sp. HJYY11 TaxID=2801333 RepID=UPI00191E5E4A|nr:DUF3617 domain-containing protein [Piscinibacter sp. HJYY11]MBL0729371.1 DUF3617 domain-containing protein [Piscinibacter sp. HJYY11]